MNQSRSPVDDPSAHHGQHRESDLRRALSIYRARGVGGESVIHALWTLAWNLVAQAHAGAAEKWIEVEPVAKEAVAEAHKFPGRDFPEMASVLHNWADAKLALGEYAAAEALQAGR